jgi:hypothetical protein
MKGKQGERGDWGEGHALSWSVADGPMGFGLLPTQQKDPEDGSWGGYEKGVPEPESLITMDVASRAVPVSWNLWKTLLFLTARRTGLDSEGVPDAAHV